MNIALFDKLGLLDEINEELDKYDAVNPSSISDFANRTFRQTNSSTLKIKTEK